MKHLKLLTLAFCVIAKVAIAQNISPEYYLEAVKAYSGGTVVDTAQYRVVYALHFVKDIRKPKMYDDAHMVVHIGSRYIGYLDYDQYLKDSIWAVGRKRGKNSSDIGSECDGLPISSSWDVIAVNRKANVLEWQSKIRKARYHCKMPMPKLDWKLVKGDTIIHGVNCKRATVHYAGRDYVAWYAPKYRYPYGPYVFQGLPGIIYSLYDTHHVFNFSLRKLIKAPPLTPIYFKFENTVAIDAVKLRKLKVNYLLPMWDKNGTPIKMYWPYNPMEIDEE